MLGLQKALLHEMFNSARVQCLSNTWVSLFWAVFSHLLIMYPTVTFVTRLHLFAVFLLYWTRSSRRMEDWPLEYTESSRTYSEPGIKYTDIFKVTGIGAWMKLNQTNTVQVEEVRKWMSIMEGPEPGEWETANCVLSDDRWRAEQHTSYRKTLNVF